MRNFNIQDELVNIQDKPVNIHDKPVNIHDKPVNIHDELVNIQDGSFVKSRKYHHADTGKGTYFDCFAAQLCKFWKYVLVIVVIIVIIIEQTFNRDWFLNSGSPLVDVNQSRIIEFAIKRN